MPAFLLSLREGLEAALILGIVLGTLRRLGHRDLYRYVWLDAGAVLLASVLVALGLAAVGAEFEGRMEQVFQGITLLLASRVLTWMIFSMQRQGWCEGQRLAADVRLAAAGTGISLFAVAVSGGLS